MIASIFFIFCAYLFFLTFGIFFQKHLIRKNLYDNRSLFETIFFGIFFVTIISLFFNFFVKLHSIFFITLLILAFLYSIFSFKKLIIKNVKKLLLYSIILSPLCTFLDFGYDAGLYHIPYQAILQNDHINFGIINLHERFGLTTSYGYVAALLWHKNFFNFVSGFSTVLFSLFFIFVLEKLKTKKVLDIIFSLSALITFPLWYRYAELSISLVDLFFSIFYFFTFYYGAQIIFHKEHYNKEFKEKIFLFLIFLSYTVTTKPTAALVSVYFVLIVLLKHRYFFKNIIDIIKNNLISISFIIFWIIRNVIISSCLNFPITISCLDLSWKTNRVLDLNQSVILWNSYIFDNFLKFILNYQLTIFFVLFLIILFLFFLKKIIIFLIDIKSQSFKFFYLLFLVLLLFYQPLEGITWKIQSRQFTEAHFGLPLNTIYIREIFLLFISYVMGFVFVIMTLKRPVLINDKITDFKFSKLIPLIFFLFSLSIWLIFGPNPRLGQYLFLPIIPSFMIAILSSKVKIEYVNVKYFKLLILIIIIKISIVDNLDKIKDPNDYYKNHITNKSKIIYKDATYRDYFILLKHNAPDVKVKKRDNFGFSPSNNENLCWTKSYCHPYSEVEIFKNYLGYKFFKEFKN